MSSCSSLGDKKMRKHYWQHYVRFLKFIQKEVELICRFSKFPSLSSRVLLILGLVNRAYQNHQMVDPNAFGVMMMTMVRLHPVIGGSLG